MATNCRLRDPLGAIGARWQSDHVCFGRHANLFLSGAGRRLMPYAISSKPFGITTFLTASALSVVYFKINCGVVWPNKLSFAQPNDREIPDVQAHPCGSRWK